MKTAPLVLLLVASAFTQILFAQQPGTLDGDFDADGRITTDFSAGPDYATAVTVQPDGKIIACGYARLTNDDFAIVRYNTDGSLDNNFSSSGKLTIDIQAGADMAYAVLVQPDGKIVVAGRGSTDMVLVRYNSNGTIDNTFSIDGIAFTTIGTFAVALGTALQSDGKIVVTGDSQNSNGDFDIMVARYNADGTLDNTFSTDGKVTTAINLDENESGRAVAIQSDGKIVVAGYANRPNDNDFAVVRYNTDGTLDVSFDGDGKVTTDFTTNYNEEGNSVVIQPDGKIIVGGGYVTAGDFALARYNTDGSLDTSFNSTGKVIFNIAGTQYGCSIALQPDGKIVASGTTYGATTDFALVRLNPGGSADTTFGTGGKVTTDFGGNETGNSLALQPDGKIVVAGSTSSGTFDFAVARYISGFQVGVLDFSSLGNLVIYPNPIREHESLEFTLAQDEVMDISLYDLSGKLIKTFIRHQSMNKGTHLESLDFGASLPSGNYVLRLSNGNGSSSIRVAKQ